MTQSGKKVLTRELRPSLPYDSTLQREIQSLGEDDLMEFMNLTSEQTGIDGIVFVSTAMGPHGPRVKYFVKERINRASRFPFLMSRDLLRTVCLNESPIALARP